MPYLYSYIRTFGTVAVPSALGPPYTVVVVAGGVLDLALVERLPLLGPSVELISSRSS